LLHPGGHGGGKSEILHGDPAIAADRIMPDAKKLGKKLERTRCPPSLSLSSLVVFLSSGDYFSGDLITELFNSDDSCVPTSPAGTQPPTIPFYVNFHLPDILGARAEQEEVIPLFFFLDNEDYISICKSSVYPFFPPRSSESSSECDDASVQAGTRLRHR